MQRFPLALPALCSPRWGPAAAARCGLSVQGQRVQAAAKLAKSCLPPWLGLLPLRLAPDPGAKLAEN